jgi:hypothetical protein
MDPQKKERERETTSSRLHSLSPASSVPWNETIDPSPPNVEVAARGWGGDRLARQGRAGSLSSSGTPRPGKFLGVAVAGPTGAAHAPAPRVAFVRLPCLSSRSSPWPWARADTDGRACARTAQRYEAAAVRRVGWFAEPSTRGHVWRVRSGSRRLGRSGTRAAVVPLHLAESRTRAHCASS